MFYVGIDWADQTHEVFITDDSGKKLDSFGFKNDQEGFLHCLDKIRSLSGESNEVLFALETDKGLLVDALLTTGYIVYAINPKSADRYRDRHRGSGAKTDPFDAMVLANILRTDRHNLRPLVPDSPLARELRILTRDREQLVKLNTRLSNQLTSCLKLYYPIALELFYSVDLPISLYFLKEYPTPEQAQALTRSQIRRFLKDHSYPGPKDKVEEIFNKLQRPAFKADHSISRSKARLASALIAQLIPLVEDIKAYDKEIAELLGRHPDGGIFNSLPGAGSNLASKLLSEIGDNHDRYDNANGLQCLAGTAPVTISSGKRKVVVMRKACIKPFRSAVHQFSFCSLKTSKWAREMYDDLRSKGYKHSHALRKIGNTWLRIIFAMWKNNEPYKEEKFLFNKYRHKYNVVRKLVA